jgi:hypothetical protein
MSDIYLHRTWQVVANHRDYGDHVKLIYGDAYEQCEHCLDAIDDLPAGSTCAFDSKVTGKRHVLPSTTWRGWW